MPVAVVPDVPADPAETDRHRAIQSRIAAVLGDQAGSYELLIASRICAALGVDPMFQGELAPNGE